MQLNEIVTYHPGTYDHTVLEGAGPFVALVTRIRPSGLVDVVFGDASGLGIARTSVGVGAASVPAEGYVAAQ